MPSTPEPAIKDQEQGCLFVVATPIGNLEDITLRALKILTQADLIAAEDTRRTRRLLTAHNISNQLISYHEHNEAQRTPELIQRIRQGDHIALVSDAGTPSVSDPGYRLVHQARKQGLCVVPIPGVSAAVTALSASGMATDQFTFVGFPQRKKNKRIQQLKELSAYQGTLIFYQSPRRLIEFMDELRSIFGDRPAVVCREMTKTYEEFVQDSLSALIEQFCQRVSLKGECTLLVGPETYQTGPDQQELEKILEQKLAETDLPIGQIAKQIALEYGLKRNTIYDMLIKIKKAQ
ncbi:MAG: 16S rRNA (cytidine(1402)-2'-O)-methyltransferase [Desulfobacteraceae bacterium]|nr:16S rRNA (cytidine(1402)-2'-O)-methyltransferase [Desulfobacteraceae bacterium]